MNTTSTRKFEVEQVKFKFSSSTRSTVPPLFMGFSPEVTVNVPRRYSYIWTTYDEDYCYYWYKIIGFTLVHVKIDND